MMKNSNSANTAGKIKLTLMRILVYSILIFLCITLLSSAVAALKGVKRVMPGMVENSGCYKNFIYVNQDKYSDRYLVDKGRTNGVWGKASQSF